MDIRTISDLQAATAGSKAPPAKKDASSLDQGDFLKLMLQQLKSQDPLKPADNSEFISQMAQLTSVSSISEMNVNLASLTQSLYSGQLLEASSLIGKEVLINSERASLSSSGGVVGQVSLPVSTTALNVEIVAPSGEVLRKVSLGPQSAGEVSFTWDGLANDGTRLPPGNYNLQATFKNGDSYEALSTQVRAPVESVSIPPGGGGAQLQLSGLGSVSLSQVVEIR